MQSGVFKRCTSLADVTLPVDHLFPTSTDIFDESNYKQATLHVPADLVEAYKEAPIWKDFKAIVGIGDNTEGENTEGDKTEGE